MKKANRLFAAALLAVLACAFLPDSAQAYPDQGRPCTNCHLLDPGVLVTATPLGCTVRNGETLASYDYRLTVSNTYERLEGWAVFDGGVTSTTNIRPGYGPTTGGVDIVLSLNQSKTYTLRGVSDSDMLATNDNGGSNYQVVTTPFCAPCVDGDDFFSAGGASGR